MGCIGWLVGRLVVLAMYCPNGTDTVRRTTQQHDLKWPFFRGHYSGGLRLKVKLLAVCCSVLPPCCRFSLRLLLFV
uniref:Putative secreted protein n=1 Tax=Anopheles darlingi TaxID=43151 RepID=A0A2M4DHQ3_ANODA